MIFWDLYVAQYQIAKIYPYHCVLLWLFYVDFRIVFYYMDIPEFFFFIRSSVDGLLSYSLVLAFVLLYTFLSVSFRVLAHGFLLSLYLGGKKSM